MHERTRRKVKILIGLVALFSSQFIVLALLNYPWIRYYEDDEVEEIKEEIMEFAYLHQNPDSGLFIEPSIDSCFKAVCSINPYDNPYEEPINLVNPLLNYDLDSDKRDLFFDYLFEKQNKNGSFSDICGLGNMFSTYEVIETIDKFKPSYFSLKTSEIGEILEFIKKSYNEIICGYKNSDISIAPDIISTYCAIKLANLFNAANIYNRNNVSRYVNATLISLLAAPAGYSSPEEVYYGINAFLELGMTFNPILNASISLYFSLRQSLVEGGYSVTPGSISDVQSTYYSLASLYTMNIKPTFENRTLQFVLRCAKLDGGFGLNPLNYFESDFTSGWAAMNSIYLIQENNDTMGNVNTYSYRFNYYGWLSERQGMNGLFGRISIEANYYGVLSIYLVDSENLSDLVEIDNIWDYAEDCYNHAEGGFGTVPNRNSSIYSTYCVVKLYEILLIYDEDIELPDKNDTIDYLVDLQNLDGGFELDIDFEEIFSFFGPISYMLEEFIDIEIDEPIVESTYWATASLTILHALHEADEESLIHWIRSCQNADGGFSIVLGFHSDVISTYYGLETFILLDAKPMSEIAAIEFLKNAQNDDGSFMPFPMLSQFYELPSSFLVTYLGSKALYDYGYQPENIEDLIDWFEECLSPNTGGVGDIPMFGGDLRNCPYGIIFIEELTFDQEFNPTPWNDLITVIFLFELLLIVLYCFKKMITILNVSISKKLKERFEIGEKFNISYLQKFPAIQCENVNIYAGRKLIVDSVTMQLEHGEILGVLGESGAGKSTFVKSLLGMRKFTGVNKVYGMNVKTKAKKMRPIYGYVPQDLSKIYQNFTVLQNILFFGKQYNLTEKEIKHKTNRILRSLEIDDKLNEKVKNLSGGQKRRVSIAMALIHNPVIVWMDEPTSGLDAIVRTRLLEVILKLKDQFGMTFVIISHYPEEANYCNKIAIFGRKRGMIAFGKKKDLIKEMAGNGRSIHLSFNKNQSDVITKMEGIEGIEKALENVSGIQYVIFSDLTLNTIKDNIKKRFGPNSIRDISQKESTMEEYFRYRSIETPKI